MSSCGKNENPQEMNRRKFLKVFGGGAVASSAALYGCAPKNEPGAAVALGEVPRIWLYALALETRIGR